MGSQAVGTQGQWEQEHIGHFLLLSAEGKLRSGGSPQGEAELTLEPWALDSLSRELFFSNSLPC